MNCCHCVKSHFKDLNKRGGGEKSLPNGFSISVVISHLTTWHLAVQCLVNERTASQTSWWWWWWWERGLKDLFGFEVKTFLWSGYKRGPLHINICADTLWKQPSLRSLRARHRSIFILNPRSHTWLQLVLTLELPARGLFWRETFGKVSIKQVQGILNPTDGDKTFNMTDQTLCVRSYSVW